MPRPYRVPFDEIKNLQNKLSTAHQEYLHTLESIFCFVDTLKLMEFLDFCDYPNDTELEIYHYAITNILEERNEMNAYRSPARKKVKF